MHSLLSYLPRTHLFHSFPWMIWSTSIAASIGSWITSCQRRPDHTTLSLNDIRQPQSNERTVHSWLYFIICNDIKNYNTNSNRYDTCIVPRPRARFSMVPARYGQNAGSGGWSCCSQGATSTAWWRHRAAAWILISLKGLLQGWLPRRRHLTSKSVTYSQTTVPLNEPEKPSWAGYWTSERINLLQKRWYRSITVCSLIFKSILEWRLWHLACNYFHHGMPNTQSWTLFLSNKEVCTKHNTPRVLFSPAIWLIYAVP